MQTPLEKTIGALYETVLDDTHWPVALRELAALFNAPRAALIEHDFVAGTVAGAHLYGHDSAIERDYAGHYHAIDPGRLIGISAGVGEWLSDEQVLDVRSKIDGEYVHDFALRYEIGHVAGCKITGDSKGCEYLSLARPIEAGRFGEPARDLHMSLKPHLERVSKVRRRLSELSQGKLLAHATLDRFQAGIFLVDPSLRIQFANASAGHLLTKWSSVVSTKSQRLACLEPSVHERLARLVSVACSKSPCGGTLRIRCGQEPSSLILIVLPTPQQHQLAMCHREPVAMLIVCDPDAEAIPLDLCRSLFSLTAAEAALLSALARGVSVVDWARARGVSVATVRSQLHALFEKTGVSSQARLVSLVKSVPALVTASDESSTLKRCRPRT